MQSHPLSMRLFGPMYDGTADQPQVPKSHLCPYDIGVHMCALFDDYLNKKGDWHTPVTRIIRVLTMIQSQWFPFTHVPTCDEWQNVFTVALNVPNGITTQMMLIRTKRQTQAVWCYQRQNQISGCFWTPTVANTIQWSTHGICGKTCPTEASHLAEERKEKSIL